MLNEQVKPSDIEQLKRSGAAFDRALFLARQKRATAMLVALDICACVDKAYAAEIIRRSAVIESEKDC